MKKLKLRDWIYIIASILLLIPVLVYAYGTLIFGYMGFSHEQKIIVSWMGIAYLFATYIYCGAIWVWGNDK